MPRERFQTPTLCQTKRGVWFIRPAVDRIGPGGLERAKKTIVIGRMGKREAQARANEIMRTINRADYVITSQIQLAAFLEEFETLHVARLAVSTQANYRYHIKKHIRELAGQRLCDLDRLLLQKWLDSKTALSWATKKDLRKVLCCIFSKAIEWGRWKDANPVSRLHIGRKKPVYEQRKLTADETRRLLAALPWDVRVLSSLCLFGGLRISEALGLRGKDLDFECGAIEIRQRFWRGDIDEVKTVRSSREIPMGYLRNDLLRLRIGAPDRLIFQIAMPPGRNPNPGLARRKETCRDDRDIVNYWLRPAAKALGIYWKGFGFHSFRREAITEFSALLGANAAQRLAGHSTADMTLHYTLADREAQDAAIRQRQEAILGKDGGKVQ